MPESTDTGDLATIEGAFEDDPRLKNLEVLDSSGLMAAEVSDSFHRQRNHFPARFGEGPGLIPVIPGRYRLVGSPECGWNRRQRIVRRLLGLEEALPIENLITRAEDGNWIIARRGGDLVERFGTRRLNDFYERTDPDFTGRGTSPTIIDAQTGLVATNNYHTLSLDLETAWKPFHTQGAPDLYPEDLRPRIDLLNQQLFDDVNDGTYRTIEAPTVEGARAAYGIFEARLREYDFRLASRRYLFGNRLTDSDVRLFQTISSFDRIYRPAMVARLGEGVIRLPELENLWGYGRDLFQQGFVDEVELYYLTLVPGPSGNYLPDPLTFGGELPALSPKESLAAWRAPSGREELGGDSIAPGPGDGGSVTLWHLRGDPLETTFPTPHLGALHTDPTK